ncbi:MAG: hypothetical protein WAS07_11920 [Micropruina sp.]
MAVTLTSLSLFAAATPSIAAPGDIDNLVPSSNYNPHCNQIASGNWSAATVCLTDNRDVYYYMDSAGEYELEQDDKNKVAEALQNEYVPTDLNIYYDSTPVFSGEGETDIIYQEGNNIPSDAAGITWCNDEAGGTTYECDQTYIRIRTGGAYNLRRSCHETGHAVGLLHGPNASPSVDWLDSRLGCMRTPTNDITSGDLGSNQVYWINQHY